MPFASLLSMQCHDALALCRSLLATGGDLSPFYKTPKLRELEYNAVILRTVSSYGGHFPDLPGAA